MTIKLKLLPAANIILNLEAMFYILERDFELFFQKLDFGDMIQPHKMLLSVWIFLLLNLKVVHKISVYLRDTYEF